MSSTAVRLGLATLGALLLSACTATRIDYQWTSLGYNLGDVSYGADHRDPRVDVIGGPPTMPPAEFAAAVAAAMPQGIGIVTRFTATPDTSAHPLYRVVWEFAPPGDRRGYGMCTTAAAPPSGPRGDGVYALFCRGPSVMSGVYGRLERAPDPSDPAFRAFVRDMTVALFPRGGTVGKGY